MTLEKALQCAEAKGQTLLRQRSPHFFDRSICIRAQGRDNGILMGVDPARPAVAAQGLRTRFALFPFALAPAAHARSAHAEPFTGLAMCQVLSQTFRQVCNLIDDAIDPG